MPGHVGGHLAAIRCSGGEMLPYSSWKLSNFFTQNTRTGLGRFVSHFERRFIRERYGLEGMIFSFSASWNNQQRKNL
jgi:hypothetical protein